MVFCTLILLSFILNHNAVAFGQTIYPSNAVAEVGKSTVFRCTTATTRPIFWVLSSDGHENSAELIIAFNCEIQNGFKNHYDVNMTGGEKTCDLHVFDITMEQAGVYRCAETTGFYAILTVIDPNPNVSVNTQDVIEGDTVIMMDSLTYNGSTDENYNLRPYLYWTDPIGQNMSSNTSVTFNSAFSQIEVVAERQDILPHTSHTAVHLQSIGESNRASNTPGDIFNYNSPKIPVYYTPNITSPTPSEQPCELATCIATANPPATYTWYVKQENRNYTQETINVTIGDYTCYACNTIRLKEYCDQVDIQITTTCTLPPVTAANTAGPDADNPTGSSNQAIIPAVVIGILLLINLISTIAFLIYYNWTPNGKKNNKEALNNLFPTLEKMLPCLNPAQDSKSNGSKCLWITLFVLISIVFGVIWVILILVVEISCCGENEHSPEGNSNPGPAVQGNGSNRNSQTFPENQSPYENQKYVTVPTVNATGSNSAPVPTVNATGANSAPAPAVTATGDKSAPASIVIAAGSKPVPPPRPHSMKQPLAQSVKRSRLIPYTGMNEEGVVYSELPIPSAAALLLLQQHPVAEEESIYTELKRV